MFESLPGFREFYPEDCSRRNHLFRIFKKVARTFAFQEFDAPILEPLALYLEKSGEEVVDQLFRFQDKGEREVALRPELTPSLARMVAARANALRRPIKWFNLGEHFRYERPQKGRLRSFYQFNADILGEDGIAADAELISLLAAILKTCGLRSEDFRIRLSDRITWSLFLDSIEVDEEKRPDLLDVIDKSERRKPEQTLESIESIMPGKGRQILEEIDHTKTTSNEEELNDRLNSFGEEGKKRAEEWKQLLALLEAHGALDVVKIDLSVVRGLAYYTGFVYEAFENSGDSRALAGGGRYDHLVKKLSGNVEMSAAGFAIGDVTLTDCLSEKKLLPEYVEAPDLYLVAGENELSHALRDANRLREAGYSVSYSLRGQGFGKQFKEAGRSRAKFALIYGEEEVLSNKVKVKDLASGRETALPSKELIQQIMTLEEYGGVPEGKEFE